MGEVGTDEREQLVDLTLEPLQSFHPVVATAHFTAPTRPIRREVECAKAV